MCFNNINKNKEREVGRGAEREERKKEKIYFGLYFGEEWGWVLVYN